jgi:GNAT superfamily N-acetyltransferase
LRGDQRRQGTVRLRRSPPDSQVDERNQSRRAELLLRRAEVRDIDCLVDFRARLLQETHFAAVGPDSPDTKDAFRQYFENHIASGEFIGWVAESGGDIVATGGMVYWHKPPLDSDPSGMEAYIMNMYTLAEWRGRGIAAKIMDMLIEDARSAGVRRIRLHASEEGSHVYKAKGFVFNPSDMILVLKNEE